jgi:hypothetical protein
VLGLAWMEKNSSPKADHADSRNDFMKRSLGSPQDRLEHQDRGICLAQFCSIPIDTSNPLKLTVSHQPELKFTVGTSVECISRIRVE